MGFDNECILNIQSLPGEYFCPICRLLVYPNEALVSQCTHLYCKPCLSYIVSTTQACPYDGYLVTEADSKPLVDANKALAETIGKITVHCLYHRSGCTWQGPLSECTSHCSSCAYGNSPVVCNRCAVQIIHRQVQEHAQICPGVQPQAQQVEGVKDASAANSGAMSNQTRTASQASTTTSQVQTQSTTTQTVGKDSNPPATNSQTQGVAQAVVPTTEQWYQQQQQFQQYYQQYPGYSPYQQQYQQYYVSQQQTVPQYQQQNLQVQPQGYVQSQPQPQTQIPSQPQAQTQAQPQSQLQPSCLPVQAPLAAAPQNQAPVNPQTQTHLPPQGHPLPQPQSYSHAQPQPQSYSHAQPQPQSYPTQPHSQYTQMPQYQQPHPQMQYPQNQNQHTVPQPLPQPHMQAQVQNHSQAQPFPQLNPPQPNQSQIQHSATLAVTAQHSYTQQAHQQMPLGGPSQPPLHVHPTGAQLQMQNQTPQQNPLMRPPQTHATVPNQQQQQPPPAFLPLPGQVPSMRPAQHPAVNPQAPPHQRPVMQSVQQPMPQQYVQQQQAFAGQHQQGPGQQQLPMQAQLRPQGLSHAYEQISHAYPQPQQNVSVAHGLQPLQPLNVVGQPVAVNHGVQSQPNQQSAAGMPRRAGELGANQPSLSQSSSLMTSNQVQLSSEHQSGATLRPPMPQKQDTAQRNVTEREAESSQNYKDEPSGPQGDAVGTKIKCETDEKYVANETRSEVEDKTNTVDTPAKNFVAFPDSQASKNVEPVMKQVAKEEVLVNGEDQKNLANIDRKVVEHSVSRDNKIQDQLQQAPQLVEQDGMQTKDKMLPQFNRAPQGPVVVPSAARGQAGSLLQSSQYQNGSSILQQRPAAPSVVQGPSLHAQALGQPSQIRPQGSGYPPPSFGGASGVSQGDPVMGLQSHAILPGGFNPQARMPARGPPYGPEGQMVQQHPMEADMFRNQKPRDFDSGRPDSRVPGSLEQGPVGQQSGIQSNTMRRNGPPGLEFQDEHLNPFPMDPTRQGIGRQEFVDLKQFPRPPLLDTVVGTKHEGHFPSSRPLDRDPHNFRMDAGPRPYGRSLNNEPVLKMDQAFGTAPRYMPSYATGRPDGPSEDALRRSDSGRPDFRGPLPGYARHDMDGLGPRSPIRDYPRITSRGFAGLPGSFGHSSLDDVDGTEFGKYGDSIGNSFRGSRFSGSVEFEGPGRTSDLIGREFLPNHLRRGEHLNPNNSRWGERGGLGGFPDHAHMGDLVRPGSFSHSRLGEPGFRSSFSHQGFSCDGGGGFYSGDIESFEHSRKRKPTTMGWCRICKVDCETVEGLDLHSQTREHQKMAMDMVAMIKQNAKKQKINSGDRASHDDANKSRRANTEGKSIK